MQNNRLTETKIGAAKVIVDIVPKGHCIPNVKIAPTSNQEDDLDFLFLRIDNILNPTQRLFDYLFRDL